MSTTDRPPTPGTTTRLPAGTTTANLGTGGVRRPSPVAPYFPHSDTATFRDLLLFEERLKMNAEMLRRRRRRYNGASPLSPAALYPRLGVSMTGDEDSVQYDARYVDFLPWA